MSSEPTVILNAIRSLPRAEQLRLVARVIHELADDGPRPQGDPHALIGMMADEPELMDQVCELAMQARSKSRMRRVDG